MPGGSGEEPAVLEEAVLAGHRHDPQAFYVIRTSLPEAAMSFRTLLQALSRLGKSRMRMRFADSEPIEKLARPTPLHEKAFSLLGLPL